MALRQRLRRRSINQRAFCLNTLHELTVAYQDKPTVVLEGTGGWSDRIRDIAYDGKHLDESGSATLRFAATPEEAVELAIQLATDPTVRPKGAAREFPG